MRETRVLVAAVVLLPLLGGCKTKKRRIAEQNNKMVALHKAIYDARMTTEQYKKEKAEYEKSVRALLVVAKKQERALAQLEVEEQMEPLKAHLGLTIGEVIKGYRAVLGDLERSKNYDAQTAITRVETLFMKRTQELRKLSEEIARKNSIKVSDLPKESRPAPPKTPSGTTSPQAPMGGATSPKPSTPPMAPEPPKTAPEPPKGETPKRAN